MSLEDGEEIEALLKYNPPQIQASPILTEFDTPALSFYDKHLSSSLALNRVAYSPTMLQNITKAMEACMDVVDAQGISIPPITDHDHFRTKRQRETIWADTKATDAQSIANLYKATTADNCQAVASTLFLTPQCSMWLSAIFFDRVDMEDNPTDQTFTLEDYSINLPSNNGEPRLHPVINDCLSEDKSQLLRSLLKRDSRLATWEFLPYTSQAISVIQNLHGEKNRGRTTTRFNMRTHPPIGAFHSPNAAIPFDAEVTPWHPQNLTRNLRPKKTASLAKTSNYPSAKVCFTPPPSKKRSAIISEVLQHAWVTACRRDSTFIIFQCGNYERIGVRHRATRTLYLSDVIDVPNITDPSSYTELHLNLYILILQDAIQRAAHLRLGPQDDLPPISQKRGRDGPLVRTRQLHKHCSSTNRLDDEVVDDMITPSFYGDISSRHLLLVSLRYGVYSSPNPATFFRSGHQVNVSGAKRSRYKATEYIHIRLTSLITRGATGTVHGGRLEAHRRDGVPCASDIVVKLAFSDAQKQRLQHEATVYEHLTKAGVDGIPTCYGIFEDSHGGPLVLVTSHEGTCLQHWTREHAKHNISVPRTWPINRKKFLRVLEAIHRAGVCHRDIRPENLVVNASDDVCIVGFDWADLASSASAIRREYQHLRNLLGGQHIPPGSYPSPVTA
ncbi:hypothetical protein CCMSSC00406_0009024 [Pleurotus cornucopiae]|uniref:Uncharacterized protein n=1 Tax=Pleurotus cornucopiae TaxID=5321 RepID=A0ACB7IY01_PLECO|nr:hypothetical protein CCMSSC00406_0009024 [Pleurotus cornucopiae]